MTRRNIRHRHAPGAYHVYNRGRGRRAIFRDDKDRREFLSLVGRFARQFARMVHVHALCLMTTHYHLIVNQLEPGALSRFMASLMNAYAKYFNRRHGKDGSLFAGPYRARRLESPKQYRWAVGYVHDNHPSGPGYEFSTHTAFMDEDRRPGWLAAGAALRQFGGRGGYERFMDDRALRARLQSEFFDLN